MAEVGGKMGDNGGEVLMGTEDEEGKWEEDEKGEVGITNDEVEVDDNIVEEADGAAVIVGEGDSTTMVGGEAGDSEAWSSGGGKVGCNKSFNNLTVELLLDALSKVIDIILSLVLLNHAV